LAFSLFSFEIQGSLIEETTAALGSGGEPRQCVAVEASMSVHITFIFICMRAESRIPWCKLWEIC
jgi:hypothetical protein